MRALRRDMGGARTHKQSEGASVGELFRTRYVRANTRLATGPQIQQVGTVLEGTVKSISGYEGAWIEVGGDPVAHIRMATGSINLKLENILQQGDQLQILIRRKQTAAEVAPSLIKDTSSPNANPTLDLIVSAEKTKVKRDGGLDRDNNIVLSLSDLSTVPDQYRVPAVDWDAFKARQLVEGIVQSVKPYGAFVEVNGAVGLLHRSQISKNRIQEVGNIFKKGDQIKAMIRSVEPEKGRLTFSTKVLEPTPGDMLTDPQLVYTKAEEMAALYLARLKLATKLKANTVVREKAHSDSPDIILGTKDVVSCMVVGDGALP